MLTCWPSSMVEPRVCIPRMHVRFVRPAFAHAARRGRTRSDDRGIALTRFPFGVGRKELLFPTIRWVLPLRKAPSQQPVSSPAAACALQGW